MLAVLPATRVMASLTTGEQPGPTVEMAMVVTDSLAMRQGHGQERANLIESYVTGEITPEDLRTGLIEGSLVGLEDLAQFDSDHNPPGMRGGQGTNWENPPGRRGGPGASPNRSRFDADNNPPGMRGGPGSNWENPPGRRGGPGTSPNYRPVYRQGVTG